MVELVKDVVIIGAGTAGLAALKVVEKKTDNYLLINAGPYGTTCARVGCMPSKLLIEAANAYHQRHTFETFGIRHAEALTIDLPAVLERVRKVRDYFVSSTLDTIKTHQQAIISGKAKLLDQHCVQVDDTIIQTKHIIIATGSRPVVPEQWQNLLGDKLLTTDTLFEQTDLKRRIAVIGLGAIGIEMAQALSRLDIEVSAWGEETLLGGLTDQAVSDTLLAQLQQTMTVHTGHQAEIAMKEGRVIVSAGDQHQEVDQVLVAIGRQPNIDDLGLDTLDVALDDKGMPEIDPQTMRIANTSVSIAGDVSAQSMLLHEVADEGRIAGHNALAESPEYFCRRVSLHLIFSDPQTAVVGKNWAELDSKEILIGEIDFADQGRARTAQKNVGLMRLYADKNTGQLLGAEMCAPAAEHMAHTLALAMTQQLTVNQILNMPIYHPVLEEGMRTALRQLQQQIEHSGQSELNRCDAFDAEALD